MPDVKCDYEACYDLIMQLREELTAKHHVEGIGCLDCRAIKALAATYELQDYLADRIARAVAAGEMELDPED